MKTTCTAEEAEARFPELLREVRRSGPVTITHDGDPVAEMRAAYVRSPMPETETIEEHLHEMERRGLISPARDPRAPLKPGTEHVPGAMERFFAERNRY